MEKNIKLRNRGQITIPKEFLEKLEAKENDFFKISYDGSSDRKIVLELISNTPIYFRDSLDTYIISDLRSKGICENDIMEKLPHIRQTIEDSYATQLNEIEGKEFIDFDEWN